MCLLAKAINVQLYQNIALSIIDYYLQKEHLIKHSSFLCHFIPHQVKELIGVFLNKIFFWKQKPPNGSNFKLSKWLIFLILSSQVLS